MSDYKNNQIIKDWLNSGEFYSDIEDVRSEILKAAKAAENERQTANAFENALYYLIRNKTGLKIDFFSEKSLDIVVHKFGSLSSRASGHGRLDAIVNNLVIEYKHYKKLGTQEQYNTACQQVYDYLQALYDNTNTKFNAILTDGLKICYFNYSEDGIHHSSLSQLSKNDIETIIKAIVLNEKKKFVPKNIIHDFSISYDIPSASKSLALELLSGWELPTEYIYPIVTSTNLDNFCYEYRNEYCILPYNQDDIKNPISIQTMIDSQRDLFNYLVNHKDLIDQQSEKSKQMHRGKEFYALSKIGKYTFAPYIVAARDNTRFCASVIKSQKTGWGNPKNSICIKHTIVISQDKSNRNIEKEEAYYISGILNSSIVVNYMHDSFKKNGFSLNKSNIYLPLFDNSNKIHKNIAYLAKKGENSKDKKEIQEQLTKFYLELCDKK